MKIETQDQLDELLAPIDWDSSFVREASIISPSYLHDHNIVASESAVGMKLFLIAPECEQPGIELIFGEVEEIHIPLRVDLAPKWIVKMGRVEFWLNPAFSSPIQARELMVNQYDISTCGWEPLYSFENMFDSGGFPLEAWGGGKGRQKIINF